MKASIKQDGTLVVAPENPLEAYALNMWSKNYCVTGNIASLTPSALQVCVEAPESNSSAKLTSCANNNRDKSNPVKQEKKTLLQAVTEWTLAENDARKILNIVADWVGQKIGDHPTFVIAEWIKKEANR